MAKQKQLSSNKVREIYLFNPKNGVYHGPMEVIKGMDLPDDFTEIPPPTDIPGDSVQVWKDGKWSYIKSDIIDKANQVIAQRDSMLKATDYTQLEDSPADKKAYAKYRQALREIPTQSGFPVSVVWPVLEPSILEGGGQKISAIFGFGK